MTARKSFLVAFVFGCIPLYPLLSKLIKDFREMKNTIFKLSTISKMIFFSICRNTDFQENSTLLYFGSLRLLLTSFTKLASQSVEIGSHFRCIRATHACTIEKPNFSKGFSTLAVTHHQTIVLNAQLRTRFDGNLFNTSSEYISPQCFYPLPLFIDQLLKHF